MSNMSNEIELNDIQKNEMDSPISDPKLKESYEIANNEEKMMNEDSIAIQKEKQVDIPAEADGTLNSTQVGMRYYYQSSSP